MKETSREPTEDDLQDQLLDDLAAVLDATRRIGDTAVDEGFYPEALRGAGDDLYGVFRAQLLVATHLARTGATLTEKLVRSASRWRRRGSRGLLELAGPPGEFAERAFRMHNHTSRSGDVEFELRLTDEKGGEVPAEAGKDYFVVPPPNDVRPGDERTLVLRVRAPGDAADPDAAASGSSAGLRVGELSLRLGGGVLSRVGVVVRATRG